MAPDV